MAQATTLYDVHGRPAFTIFKEQRIAVSLDRVSPHLVHAILAVEDQRFFEHGGLDVVRVAGAFLTNLRSGRAAQGGSTLTQQLARQSFLTAEKTYTRKMKEVIVAARIEREFEKREILQLYLNKVYFGDGLYGAEAASLGYFGKPAADLTLARGRAARRPRQVAVELRADGRPRPRDVARRNVVLQAMRDSRAIDCQGVRGRGQRAGCSSATGCAVRSRSASTSRKKFASSSSSGSDGSASTKAA